MMWNWLLVKLGKKRPSERKKIQVDIPYAQHDYRLEDFNIAKLGKNKPNMKEDCKDS